MDMKKITRSMNVLMGVTLSLCLSLLGNLTSGNFTPIIFIASFALSTVISLIIGFCIPIKKLSESASKNIRPGIGKKCFESLISDLIYTPVITLAMIILVRTMVNKLSHGNAQLPQFILMFGRSLIISLIVAFVLIYILTPLYLKLVLKKNGISGPPSAPPKDKEN